MRKSFVWHSAHCFGFLVRNIIILVWSHRVSFLYTTGSCFQGEGSDKPGVHYLFSNKQLADTVGDQLVNTVERLATKKSDISFRVGGDQNRAKLRVNTGLCQVERNITPNEY